LKPTNRAETLLSISIGVLLALLALAIITSLREKVVRVGDTAPEFEITTDNGRHITRSDFGGRLLVLNFWATWCPPCIEEMPSLDQMQRQLAPAGVVVLGVSVDQNGRDYEQFLAKAKVSFLTARDPSRRISTEYGTFKFPETYIIDARGRVLQKHIGAQLWNDPNLIRQIRALQ
jgi:cytochrome c biogenesis protein CcmG, thiol:disulfide interchange protein DsbE